VEELRNFVREELRNFARGEPQNFAKEEHQNFAKEEHQNFVVVGITIAIQSFNFVIDIVDSLPFACFASSCLVGPSEVNILPLEHPLVEVVNILLPCP
jgi:hypothetical protein